MTNLHLKPMSINWKRAGDVSGTVLIINIGVKMAAIKEAKHNYTAMDKREYK